MLTTSKPLHRSVSINDPHSSYSNSETKKRVEYWNRSATKRPTTLVITGQSQNCSVCDAPVYPAEQMLVDNYHLHPNCFRCQHCNQLLSLSNNEKMEGRFFCRAHFKLYTSGPGSTKTNPLLANARYSSALPSAIEAQSAVGRSISGKKAAYESLVNASAIGLYEKGKFEPATGMSNSKTETLLNSSTRLERTRSLASLTNGRRKDQVYRAGKPPLAGDDLPISKIVQNRLKLYEQREEPAPASPIRRSRSIGTPLFLAESTPISRAYTAPALSSPGTYDASFAAASKTNLRSRIQSYQGKSSAISCPLTPLEECFDNESKRPGKLTRTFKGVVDALISHGRQNNVEIEVRENLTRRKSLQSKPVSQVPTLVAPVPHPSTVNVEGEVSHRQTVSDLDLKVIEEQITTLSLPIHNRDIILESLYSLDQKLKAKDSYIETLHRQLDESESRPCH